METLLWRACGRARHGRSPRSRRACAPSRDRPRHARRSCVSPASRRADPRARRSRGPSCGGAATRMRSAPWRQPTISSRAARGIALTLIETGRSITGGVSSLASSTNAVEDAMTQNNSDTRSRTRGSFRRQAVRAVLRHDERVARLARRSVGPFQGSRRPRAGDVGRRSRNAPGSTSVTCASGCAGIAAAGYLTYDTGQPALHAAGRARCGARTGRRADVRRRHAPTTARVARGLFDDVAAAFKTGGGVPQSRTPPDMWDGLERFTAGWFENLLLPEWLPAMPDVASTSRARRRRRGRRLRPRPRAHQARRRVPALALQSASTTSALRSNAPRRTPRGRRRQARALRRA